MSSNICQPGGAAAVMAVPAAGPTRSAQFAGCPPACFSIILLQSITVTWLEAGARCAPFLWDQSSGDTAGKQMRKGDMPERESQRRWQSRQQHDARRKVQRLRLPLAAQGLGGRRCFRQQPTSHPTP